MSNDVKVEDLKTSNSGLAQSILNANGDLQSLRNTSTLRADEWKDIDTAVVQASQKRLACVSDLMSRGLVYNLTNALGTTVLEYEKESDMNDASVSMTAKEKGNNDALEYEIGYLPIPIIHKEFEINARKLAASRKLGQSLDTRQAQLAAKKVSDKIEDLLVTGGSNLSFGSGTIYGYEDHPNTLTGSLSHYWDDDSSGVTGPSIISDVVDMKQGLTDVKKYGPYMMYIPSNFEAALDEDYTTNYAITLRERLMKLSGIEGIRISDHVSDDTVMLVEMDTETVRMINGLEPFTMQWKSGDDMTMYFRVMAIMVPQIVSNIDDVTGISVYS